MTKSQLIEKISAKFTQLAARDIQEAVQLIFERMAMALENNIRIEIRGFGSFSLHLRKAREGRNPRTGGKVKLEDKKVPHFKPGKELKERVNRIRM